MKFFGNISNDEDIVNKKYVDDTADKVFYATKDVTTAQELIAAFNAGKIIVLRQTRIDNTYPFVVAQFSAHNASLCSLVVYNLNGMTLSNGVMVIKYVVNNSAWSIEMQNLQNKLESGTSIKTINNQSVLGEGNINIESGGSDVFEIVYEQTTYEECLDAINQNKRLIVKTVDVSGLPRLFFVVNARQLQYGLDSFAISFSCVESNYSLIPFSTTTVYRVFNDGLWNRETYVYQKQLVSGTDIKTVNGNSLLGSGNLEIGETVDIAMSDASKNAVQNKVIKSYIDTADANLQSQLGILTDLSTDDKTSLVNAINEVYEKSGEPFRLKNWATNSLNVTIPTCTSDISNTQIAKMVFSIDAVEGADYQIVGMIAYEVFDAASGGNRINCWPVCQFTGNGQKELSVRWMCGGTTDKVAKRINAWVLLKHR